MDIGERMQERLTDVTKSLEISKLSCLNFEGGRKPWEVLTVVGEAFQSTLTLEERGRQVCLDLHCTMFAGTLRSASSAAHQSEMGNSLWRKSPAFTEPWGSLGGKEYLHLFLLSLHLPTSDLWGREQDKVSKI